MKRLFTLLSITCLALFLLTACGEKEKAPEVAKPATQPAPAAAPAAAPGKTGKVTETMNAAGYTYVQVDTGKETFWAAAPEVKVQVGDSVVVPEGMPMPNYESKTLNRKFDLVYFVPSLLVNGAAPAGAATGMPEGHPQMPGGMPGMPGATGTPKVTAPADIDLKGIKKADQTVADIFSQKTALAGKPVKIRGKVVKFSPEIMGKNWLHIQDGSGQAGSNDLTVNTSSVAKVGDTVVVSGKLTVAKDYGYGYQYDVIIEDAQITKE
ncbi:MAG: nucleotide-binding protein [Desulfuromonadales bacterium]